MFAANAWGGCKPASGMPALRHPRRTRPPSFYRSARKKVVCRHVDGPEGSRAGGVELLRTMRTAHLLLVCFALLLPSTAALPQGDLPEPKPIAGARMPALSPDGKQIAFVYRGDIWVASSEGGRAVTITRNIEMDAYPQFSPDGKWIAFSSQRTGNWDIFLVPATGGAVRRLTWHSSSDLVTGWSPDGSRVIFQGRRESGMAEILSLDVRTLRLYQHAKDYEGMGYPSYSPDGSLIVYGHRDAFHWSRPRYQGSAAMQIALLDTRTGKSRYLTDNGLQHLWTRFLPDGKTLLSVTPGEPTPSSSNLNSKPEKFKDSPSRTPNLWFFDLNGKGRQITRFTGGSVRFPTVATKSGDIAFEYGSDLWLLPARSELPRRIVLYASEDEAQSTERSETLSSGATEAEPSPDGATLAFGLRGEIWTVAVEKPKGVAARSAQIARRITTWPGDDSDFLWSSDGKKLYYRSDRDYRYRLYEVDVATLATRSIWDRQEDVGNIRLSPDGKHLAFWIRGQEPGLYMLETASGAIKRVLTAPDARRNWQFGGDFTWSPDGRWHAFTVNELNGAWNVWIVAAEGGEPINVTRLNAWHGMPAWSPDGKYLYFASNRDGDGLYALPLQKEPAKPGEDDLKFEKPSAPLKIEIDFEGIHRRIRKVTGQRPQADLTVTPEGLIVFLSEGDIWTVSYDGKEVKRITSGGGISQLRMLKDGKRLFFLRNGETWSLKLEGNNPQERITFTADFLRDGRAERRAAFTQFWGAYNRSFYDPNMHGRDWEAIRGRYEPLLEAVETRSEFATLLTMMVGELEASHSEVGAAAGGPPSQSTPHLGFSFDYSHTGPGIKVERVPPGAPGSFAKTQIRPGEYVLAINGQDVTTDENLFRLINDRAGREMEFLVNSTPTREGARTVKYAALGWGEWGDILYRDRVERARQTVEQKSGGTLGYVHIAGMGFGNQVQFEREIYEQALGKKGMIIDVRFNGGGNISDTLINWLERKPHGYYRPRDGLTELAPGRAWTVPTIVLMNQHSFSNAEMFPYAMRARGIAKLVGMPTPGYVIWTWGLPLLDGTSGRLPGSGVYRLDGSPMENLGEKPDVLVPLTAEDYLAQRDPQLDKAIEMLMK